MMKKINMTILGGGIAFAILLFTFCYFAYFNLMEFIQSGVNVPDVTFYQGQADEVFEHRLLSALGWMLPAFVVTAAAILCNNKKTLQKGMTIFVGLLFITVASLGAGLYFLKYWQGHVAQSISEEFGRFDMEIGATLPFDSVRLYEVGLYVCVVVMLFAVVLREIHHHQARKGLTSKS